MKCSLIVTTAVSELSFLFLGAGTHDHATDLNIEAHEPV